MRTSTSKLTKKYQATIPEPVRNILRVAAGDAIAFDIVGKEVRLRKARPVDLAFARALEGTLTEWTTKADEEAYRDLRSVRRGGRSVSVHRSRDQQLIVRKAGSLATKDRQAVATAVRKLLKSLA